MSTRRKREERLAACVGKQGYRNGWKAQRIAYWWRHANDERLRAYRCPHCGRWHVGRST